MPAIFVKPALRKPNNITAVHAIFIRWSTPVHTSLVILRAASLIVWQHRRICRVWDGRICRVWDGRIGGVWHGRIGRVWHRRIGRVWHRSFGRIRNWGTGAVVAVYWAKILDELSIYCFLLASTNLFLGPTAPFLFISHFLFSERNCKIISRVLTLWLFCLFGRLLYWWIGRVWYGRIGWIRYRRIGGVWHGRIGRVWCGGISRTIGIGWRRCVISWEASEVVVFKSAGKSVTATVLVLATVRPAIQTISGRRTIRKPANIRIRAVVARFFGITAPIDAISVV